MGDQVTLLLIGGLISLVSTRAGIALQHWFGLQKQEREMRQHPSQVLYGKQTEFYDKAAQILPEINGYITAVNVWLGETGPDAKHKAKDSAGKTQPVWKFHELMESYSMYLPEKVLRAVNKLFGECMLLSHSPKVERTDTCLDLLVSFQNTIRECVGVDSISADLLKAFGAQEHVKSSQKGPV
jgi:hypothetical protein